MSGILRKIGQPLLNSRSSLQSSFFNQQRRGFAAGDPTQHVVITSVASGTIKLPAVNQCVMAVPC